MGKTEINILSMKKILVTGNEGYIGCVLTAKLLDLGYDVVGCDIGIFKDARFVPQKTKPTAQMYKDIREVTSGDLKNIDAIVHLAGLSNDPLGSLNPELTYEINHKASVELARSAKSAGVKRFLFSSSCSSYGVSNDEFVNEESAFNPQSVYADSKVRAERDISKLADSRFSPSFLRNATVFGVSPRMRLDLVAQNLAAYGYLNGVITILSDGSPWRPLVHIEDVADAFCFLLEAPRNLIHNQAFNVGHKDNNVQIKTIAEVVQSVMPGTRIEIKSESSSDSRSYKVDFSKLYSLGFYPKRTVLEGIREMYEVFKAVHFNKDYFENDHYITLNRYQNKINLDDWLRTPKAALAA